MVDPANASGTRWRRRIAVVGNGTSTFALPDLRPVTPNNMTGWICTVGIVPSRS